MRLAAVSVDLDEVPCYGAIHGVPSLGGDAAHAVYRKAVPRLEALLGELGITATFFVIGRDLMDPAARDAAERLHRAGHELANHSYDHLYDLTLRPAAEIREQVSSGAEALARVTGAWPRGFRAPGYTITDRVFDALGELGVAYDSSVFPCPSYYAAKVAMLASYKLRRRPTHSVLDDPRVLLAPADPYRVGRPYYERGGGLLELPVGVTRDLTGRLPYIGTSLVLAGQRGARRLTRLVTGRSFINLELHGVDLCDAEEDGLQALAPHQPDLRKPAAEKRAALVSALTALRDAHYELVTLADAAHVFSSLLPVHA